jgi:hypothetical protein
MDPKLTYRASGLDSVERRTSQKLTPSSAT